MIQRRNGRDPGFGVYVHWPFCAAKCPYCDFNSHVRFGAIDQRAYLAAYRAELDYMAALTGPRTVASVFFGGGTPSLMEASTVGGILDHIAAVYTIGPDAEITLEANPTSVEAGRFRGYRSAGVNRVSLGVQSLEDAQLKALGRLHSATEAKAAIKLAAGIFDRFTFDLIYARPGQMPADWRSELTQALAIAGSHLSAYQLSIEPDTPFAALHAAGKLVVPDADAALALYELTQDLTSARGLPQYEISNHAAPGEESRHNLLYWRYGEYAGIGPGAHGRVVIGGTRHATVTEKTPEGWRAHVETHGNGITEQIALTGHEQADEMLLMGLRLAEGLDLDRLAALTGHTPSDAAIQSMIEIGMLEPLAGTSRIRASREGRFVLNAIVSKLSAGMAASPNGVNAPAIAATPPHPAPA
jgi:oxygen-independent coproporphyrinogen-3 oxidase